MDCMNAKKTYESPVVVLDSGFEKEVLSSGGGCSLDVDQLGDGCQGWVGDAA